MKKAVTILLMTLVVITLISIPAFAKEITVIKGLKTNVWNDILNQLIQTPMSLAYDTNEKSIIWCVNYTLFPVAIVLDNEDRATLLKYIEKYKEWNSKASAKGVTLKKDIGSFNAKVVWKIDKWYLDPSVNVYVKFFSQSKQRHQLIIRFEELQSGYATQRPEQLYFSWDEVVAFERAISDASYDRYRKEAEKQLNIDEEFK